MVKIPGLNDLKKIGSDLMDSAKTVKLGGVVDKLKTGIESVSKKGSAEFSGDDPLAKLLLDANTVLNELIAVNAAQAAAIKKMQSQLAEIAKVATTYQKPVVQAVSTETAEPSQKPEDNK